MVKLEVSHATHVGWFHWRDLSARQFHGQRRLQRLHRLGGPSLVQLVVCANPRNDVVLNISASGYFCSSSSASFPPPAMSPQAARAKAAACVKNFVLLDFSAAVT
jgi:hypothetical protein